MLDAQIFFHKMLSSCGLCEIQHLTSTLQKKFWRVIYHFGSHYIHPCTHVEDGSYRSRGLKLRHRVTMRAQGEANFTAYRSLVNSPHAPCKRVGSGDETTLTARAIMLHYVILLNIHKGIADY